MTWLTPDVAVSVLIYACSVGTLCLPIAAVAGMLKAIRTYAPPPLGRVLSSRKLEDGRWLLRIRWHSRCYRVVGEERTWAHRSSGRTCKSAVMRGWLHQRWLELEECKATEEPVTDTSSVIRMEEVGS